jgi:hypothetical protein
MLSPQLPNPTVNVLRKTLTERRRFISFQSKCVEMYSCFFTLLLRVCSDELSFSKVKVIKYCKRNFIRQTKLNNLAVLPFEHKKQQKKKKGG